MYYEHMEKQTNYKHIESRKPTLGERWWQAVNSKKASWWMAWGSKGFWQCHFLWTTQQQELILQEVIFVNSSCPWLLFVYMNLDPRRNCTTFISPSLGIFLLFTVECPSIQHKTPSFVNSTTSTFLEWLSLTTERKSSKSSFPAPAHGAHCQPTWMCVQTQNMFMWYPLLQWCQNSQWRQEMTVSSNFCFEHSNYLLSTQCVWQNMLRWPPLHSDQQCQTTETCLFFWTLPTVAKVNGESSCEEHDDFLHIHSSDDGVWWNLHLCIGLVLCSALFCCINVLLPHLATTTDLFSMFLLHMLLMLQTDLTLLLS